MLHEYPKVFVARDARELHHVNLPGEPRESVGSGIVKVQVMDEQLIARLAKECVEAGAGYCPGESVLEWHEKAQSVLGKRYGPGPSGDVLGLMRNVRLATMGVYPRGSEGEDLSGSHASAQADEEGVAYFRALSDWWHSDQVAEMPKQPANLSGVDAAMARWVIARRTEPAKGSVSAPLPLIPSDSEDVGQEVDVSLHGPLSNASQTIVPPHREIVSSYINEWFRGEFGVAAQKAFNALPLEVPPALPDADLIPVPDKSLAERLTGYRPTLHRENLGLLRGGPGVAGSLGLEGARLANSVPSDLEAPPVLDLPDVSHARNVRRNPRGKNRG